LHPFKTRSINSTLSERVELIEVLWDSLDEEHIREVEAKWAAESEDRIDAFERGELSAVDGLFALEELRF
jgi:putative addiction module component (TIGR02574 family)